MEKFDFDPSHHTGIIFKSGKFFFCSTSFDKKCGFYNFSNFILLIINLANGEQLASAVCAQTLIPGKSVSTLEFNLIWDMPKINFHENKKQYWKYYTRFFGKEKNGPKLSAYCFENYKNWDLEIDKWQNPILNDDNLPSWYKSALFNETYFVSDGGTVWLDLDEDEKKLLSANDPR